MNISKLSLKILHCPPLLREGREEGADAVRPDPHGAHDQPPPGQPPHLCKYSLPHPLTPLLLHLQPALPPGVSPRHVLRGDSGGHHVRGRVRHRAGIHSMVLRH